MLLFMHGELSMLPIFRYKDGVPINTNSTCYKMFGFNLIITDVQQKHAGVFTLSLGNHVKGLYRNLSYTLVVDGKLSHHKPDNDFGS